MAGRGAVAYGRKANHCVLCGVPACRRHRRENAVFWRYGGCPGDNDCLTHIGDLRNDQLEAVFGENVLFCGSCCEVVAEVADPGHLKRLSLNSWFPIVLRMQDPGIETPDALRLLRAELRRRGLSDK